MPDAIYDKVRLLRERADEGLLEVPEILSGRRANARERAYTMVALCRAARIPARLVKGLVVRESAAASLHFWVEVYQSGRWQPFDPAFGCHEVLPPSYLPFVKGVREVVGFSATSDYGVEYSIVNADPLWDLPESTHGDWREVLDLTRLPLDKRIMLAALMLQAVLCIPIVRYEELGHALIRYPELHLVTLAVILALTLYKRKRLSQLPGFSWLDWAERPKPKI